MSGEQPVGWIEPAVLPLSIWSCEFFDLNVFVRLVAESQRSTGCWLFLEQGPRWFSPQVYCNRKREEGKMQWKVLGGVQKAT